MLLSAIQERPVDIEHVKRLIPSASEEEKRKSLEYAILIENRTLLRFLSQNGIDINSPDFAGYTPLHHAVLQGKTSVVKKILELGGDPSIRDYQFESPADIALRNKNLDMIRIFEAKPTLSYEQAKMIPGFGVKDEINYSQNVLNEKLIKFLVSHGLSEKEARALFLSKDGNCNGWAFLVQYYIGLESEEEFYDILKCISRWDPEKQSEPYDVLLSDIKDISPKIATKYRTLGKLLNLTANDLAWFQQTHALSTETTLKQHERIKQWEAIKRPDEKIQLKDVFSIKGPSIEKNDIKEMLELAKRWPNSWIDIGIHTKADVHHIEGHAISIYVTPSGKFKFYDSNRKKRLPEIASTELISNYIMNALRQESVVTGFDLYRFYPKDQPIPEKVEPNIDAAETQYANEAGKVLLRNAAVSGQTVLVKRLLKEGGMHFVTSKDPAVLNALSRLAMVKQDKEINDILKNNGVTFGTKVYADAAKMALAQGEIRSLVRIFESGELKKADINIRDDDDLAALHKAISEGDKDSVKDLLRLEADKELKHNHETPLFQAARLGQESIVKQLIKYKADINYQKTGYGNDVGFTPLHIAIREGNVKVVEILLLKGADITLRNKNGQTAFEIKPERNEKEIASLIEKFNKGLLEHHKHKRKAPIIVKAPASPELVFSESLSTDDVLKKKEGPK